MSATCAGYDAYGASLLKAQRHRGRLYVAVFRHFSLTPIECPGHSGQGVEKACVAALHASLLRSISQFNVLHGHVIDYSFYRSLVV